MKFSLTSRLAIGASAIGVAAIMLPSIAFAAAPTLSASQTVRNDAALTDQTDVTTPTQANVTEVKASRTLTVSSAPTNTQNFTIGTCVVTFATTTSGVPANQ